MTASAPDPLVLQDRVSQERLSPYLADATPAGDIAAALRLYSWNVELSGGFFELLGYLEIILRNAMHDELTKLATAQGAVNWFDQAAWFTAEANKDIATAKAQLTRDGKPITPGRMVAALNFSFWRYLLGRHYDPTLWRFALFRAFPNGTGRREPVYQAVERMVKLRNRIAHHEPIFGRTHADDHGDVLTVAGWISQDACGWIEANCRVHSVLSRRP